MWSIRTIYCRRCGKLLGVLPEGEGYREALIRDFNGRCPRCRRILKPSGPEYHHELYYPIKSIIWKITHPWRLFK